MPLSKNRALWLAGNKNRDRIAMNYAAKNPKNLPSSRLASCLHSFANFGRRFECETTRSKNYVGRVAQSSPVKTDTVGVIESFSIKRVEFRENVGALFPEGQSKLLAIMSCPYKEGVVFKAGFDTVIIRVSHSWKIAQKVIKARLFSNFSPFGGLIYHTVFWSLFWLNLTIKSTQILMKVIFRLKCISVLTIAPTAQPATIDVDLHFKNGILARS